MIIKVDEAKKFDIAAARVRTERDKLLLETDWMVTPDRPVSQNILDYRQALRDITAQAGFPYDIVWPTKP